MAIVFLLKNFKIFTELFLLTAAAALMIFVFARLMVFLFFLNYKIFVLGDISYILQLLSYAEFFCNVDSTPVSLGILNKNLEAAEQIRLNEGAAIIFKIED